MDNNVVGRFDLMREISYFPSCLLFFIQHCSFVDNTGDQYSEIISLTVF